MTTATSYDTRELLPRLRVSARHPSSTIRCSVSPSDASVGRDLSGVVRDVYGSAPLPPRKIVVHFQGTAGDRFGDGLASGVTFVVDSIGPHGCTGMRGGCVVVLQDPPAPFAEGLLDGAAFVCADDPSSAPARFPSLRVSPVDPGSPDDLLLQSLLAEHADFAHSDLARSLLASWPLSRPRFLKLSPHAPPAS